MCIYALLPYTYTLIIRMCMHFLYARIQERDQITVPDPSDVNASLTDLTLPKPSSTTTTSTTIHPALLLFNSRPEPKPLSSKRITPPSESMTATWSAGGYNPMLYTHRNWKEVVTGFIVTYTFPVNKRAKLYTTQSNDITGEQPISSDTMSTSIHTHTATSMYTTAEWREPVQPEDMVYAHSTDKAVLAKVIADVGATLPYNW